jgi:hypothetical protein
MKTMMKAGALVVCIAALSPISDSQAGTPQECRAAYRECIAANFPAQECEDGYYYCLYGYLPVKSAALPLVDGRRD